jgi:signal transduction histidine kinase
VLLPRLDHRLIFASAIFLLLVCGSALSWMLYRIYNGEEWVRHTYTVQLLVAEIGSNLNRTGRVRQTYLDTGNQRYLEDIEATRAEIFDKISQLKGMVRDNLDEERAAENLEEAARARFLTFDESLQLFRSGKSTPESQGAYTQELVRWSQQTSSIIRAMQETESNLLGCRLLITKSLFYWIIGVLVFSYLLSIYMLWEHYRGLSAELNQRKRAEENALSLSSQLLNAQDQERRKIARDLHDGLGQNLAAAKMITDSMLNRPADQRKLLELSAILHDAVVSTRSISHLLHPPLVDELGFVCAARSYLEGFSSRTGVQLNVDLPDYDERLPRDLELTLFRVLQEALSNIQRHSKSAKAEVHFRADHRKATLNIRDFGVGLPSDTIRRFQENGTNVGVGLAGMKERVRERNGRFELHSDSAGTSISATFPVGANGSSPAA